MWTWWFSMCCQWSHWVQFHWHVLKIAFWSFICDIGTKWAINNFVVITSTVVMEEFYSLWIFRRMQYWMIIFLLQIPQGISWSRNDVRFLNTCLILGIHQQMCNWNIGTSHKKCVDWPKMMMIWLKQKWLKHLTFTLSRWSLLPSWSIRRDISL